MRQLWNWSPLLLIGALLGRLVSDEVVVLAVNTADSAAALRIEPAAWTNRSAVSVQRIFDSGALQLSDGILTDQIPARQRRVYQLTLKP